MSKNSRRSLLLLPLLSTLSLAACGGGGGLPIYTVGGTVQGLSGSGLVLQLNGGDDLAVSSDGVFRFPRKLLGNAPYEVTVLSSAPGQTSMVAKGSGLMSWAPVTDVAVTCTSFTYTVGGSVAGLDPATGLVLQLNGGAALEVAGDGPYTFPEPVAHGADYVVTVLSSPPERACGLTNATGTMQAADVTDVDVQCSALYSVGGVVEGLSGPGLILQLNGGDDLALDGDGPYTFTDRLPDGASYTVTVLAGPPDGVCELSNASGTIQGADVTDVDVACATLYSVGGVVGGLSGPGLVLQLNGGSDLALDQDGPFAFEAMLPSGADYEVTLSSAPPGQACVIAGGSGAIPGADVTSVAATCRDVVTGLAGTSPSSPSIYSRIDAATGVATEVSIEIEFEAVTGLAYDPAARRLYAVDVATATLLAVDPLFGAATPVGSPGDLGIADINGLTFDAQSSVLYGVASTPGSMSGQLVEIDLVTGVASTVGLGFPIGDAVCLGLAFVDSSGVLYASTNDGRLVTIDSQTGASIGELSLGITVPVDGLAYDADVERLYGTMNQQRLLEIDPVTGQTSLVGLVTGFFGINGLAHAPDLDVLFGTVVNSGAASFLLQIDPQDASGLPVGSTGFRVDGLAYDPASGEMFGITFNSVFLRMDPNTGEPRFVKPVQTPGSMHTRSLVFNPGTSTLFTYAIAPGPGGEDSLIELDREGSIVQDHGPSPTMGGEFTALTVDATGPTMYGLLDRGLTSPAVLCRVEPDGGVMVLHKLNGYDQLRALAFDPNTAGANPTFYSVDTIHDMLVRIDLMTGAVTDVGPTSDTRGMVWIEP